MTVAGGYRGGASEHHGASCTPGAGIPRSGIASTASHSHPAIPARISAAAISTAADGR